jgi:hypothetical protein
VVVPPHHLGYTRSDRDQRTGLPVETQCAPTLADWFGLGYEIEFIEKLAHMATTTTDQRTRIQLCVSCENHATPLTCVRAFHVEIAILMMNAQNDECRIQR